MKKPLKSADPSNQIRAQQLDREIKRHLRTNHHGLENKIAYQIEISDPVIENIIPKGALALQQTKDVVTVRVYSNELTDFMRSIQADPRTTPIVSVQC